MAASRRRFVTQKVVFAVLTVFAVITFNFFLFRVLPGDPAVASLPRKDRLGPALLVAPVMSAPGEVTFHVPAGTWTPVLTGERLVGPGWVTHAPSEGQVSGVRVPAPSTVAGAPLSRTSWSPVA